MKANRVLVLSGLLIWICFCVAGGIHFAHPFAGAVLVFAPLATLFPSVTGVLAYVGEPIYLALLLVAAIIGWKKSSLAAIIFCCMLMGSLLYGWSQLEKITPTPLSDTTSQSAVETP